MLWQSQSVYRGKPANASSGQSTGSRVNRGRRTARNWLFPIQPSFQDLASRFAAYESTSGAVLYTIREGEKVVDVLALRKLPPYDYGDLHDLLGGPSDSETPENS